MSRHGQSILHNGRRSDVSGIRMADFLTGEAGRAMLSRGMTKSSGRMDGGALMLAIKLATVELKLQSLEFALERHYRPDQPRVPAGHPQGGQWTSTGGQARKRERVRTAFGAIYVWERQVAHPVLGLARKCFYRDMLDRWFAVPVGIDKQCPPTYPADPTE